MLTCVFSILEYQKDVRSWQDYIRQLASEFQESYLVLLSRKSSQWPRKERFCLLRKRMTSIIIRITVLHFLRSLSVISSISLSTDWWMWSRSVSSYHLSKESRWTLEFSWSNKQGFECQKVLKGLLTNKHHFPIEITCNRSNIILNRCLNILPMISEPFNRFSASCKTMLLTDNSNFFLPISYFNNSNHRLERSFFIPIFLVQLWLSQLFYHVLLVLANYRIFRGISRIVDP